GWAGMEKAAGQARRRPPLTSAPSARVAGPIHATSVGRWQVGQSGAASSGHCSTGGVSGGLCVMMEMPPTRASLGSVIGWGRGPRRRAWWLVRRGPLLCSAAVPVGVFDVGPDAAAGAELGAFASAAVAVAPCLAGRGAEPPGAPAFRAGPIRPDDAVGDVGDGGQGGEEDPGAGVVVGVASGGEQGAHGCLSERFWVVVAGGDLGARSLSRSVSGTRGASRSRGGGL